MVITQDSLTPYIITVGERFPVWTKLQAPAGSARITDCLPFITSGNQVMLSAMAGSGMYIADPTTVAQDGWVEDIGVRGAFSASVTNYAISASLGKNINDTTFGYAMASSLQGLGLLTGGYFSSSSPPAALVSKFGRLSFVGLTLCRLMWTQRSTKQSPSLPCLSVFHPRSL
jgi:hypothetical protein